MGYRSDVAIVIKKDIYEKNVDVFSNVTYSAKLTEGSWVLLNYHWIKWYESYEDISGIVKILTACDTKNFEFLRIGEDAGDVERYGCALDENEDMPFFVYAEHYVSFGLAHIPDWKSDIDKTVNNAQTLLSTSKDSKMWDYLCEQVDHYRNSKN